MGWAGSENPTILRCFLVQDFCQQKLHDSMTSESPYSPNQDLMECNKGLEHSSLGGPCLVFQPSFWKHAHLSKDGILPYICYSGIMTWPILENPCGFSIMATILEGLMTFPFLTNQPTRAIENPIIFNYCSTNSYLVVLVCGVLFQANLEVMSLSYGFPA